jgi:hypothetical protein
MTLRSAEEFREVMDRVFTMMSLDPDMGPKLRAADVPQRFDYPDVDLVLNVRSAPVGADGGHHLEWEWADESWEPVVQMTMEAEVANRYFQGKENIPMALARRRIKASGNIKKAIDLMPITKPIFAQYRAMLEAEYPHLIT